MTIAIRDLREDERAWANDRYRDIRFAESPEDAVALVAELAGVRVGLGRLVEHGPGVVELGGIWTDDTVRRRGVARAMVDALLARLADRPRAGAAGTAGAGTAGAGTAGAGTAGAGTAGAGGVGAAETGGDASPVWCIPFAHLSSFYQSFGFAPRPPPWPAAIAAKVAACVADGLPEVVVLAR